MKRFTSNLLLLILFCICFIHCEIQDQKQNITSVQRFAELIKVKPEFEERYIILHKYTFPGVLDRIYKSNLRNYSIFLQDGLLFAYYEYIGDNFQADMKKIEQDSITNEWWKLTKPMLEMLDTRKPGEWWASMEQVLYINFMQVPSPNAKRYAYTIDLPSNHEQDFRDALNNVDERFKDLLLKSNLQNISIYLKDGRLYCYLEYTGNNYKSDIQKLAGTPEFENLNQLTMPLLHKVPTAKPTEWWSLTEEVFHTN